MEQWKHIGTLLTGIAALITASIPIASYFKDLNIKNAYKQAPPVSRQLAIVNDPDGWVNLRVEPTVNSPIIIKIENGYQVEIVSRSGNWAKIKTQIGDTGYIYFNRLQIKK